MLNSLLIIEDCCFRGKRPSAINREKTTYRLLGYYCKVIKYRQGGGRVSASGPPCPPSALPSPDTI